MLNEDFGVWLKWQIPALGLANEERVFVLWGNLDFSCTSMEIFSPVLSWFGLEAWVSGFMSFDCCQISFTLLHMLTWDAMVFGARDITADLLAILWSLSIFSLTVSLILSNDEAAEAVLSDSSHE